MITSYRVSLSSVVPWASKQAFSCSLHPMSRMLESCNGVRPRIPNQFYGESAPRVQKQHGRVLAPPLRSWLPSRHRAGSLKRHSTLVEFSRVRIERIATNKQVTKQVLWSMYLRQGSLRDIARSFLSAFPQPKLVVSQGGTILREQREQNNIKRATRTDSQ